MLGDQQAGDEQGHLAEAYRSPPDRADIIKLPTETPDRPISCKVQCLFFREMILQINGVSEAKVKRKIILHFSR